MSVLLQQLDERGVLTLTLNRPEVHNAFDRDLIDTLTKALKKAEKDKAVRVVVLTGNGASFSAGADLNWMRSLVTASVKVNENDALKLAALMRRLNYLDRPTIAAINGAAFGGGLGLIACCDITLAADSARFGLTESKLGLAPAVISPYVMRRIGEHHARRYFMTGEHFDADQARNLGLVQNVLSAEKLGDAVESTVQQLLKAGPRAVRTCKKLVFAVGGHKEAKQRKLDTMGARLIAQLRVSSEGQEGLAAFLEKRKPEWTNESS